MIWGENLCLMQDYSFNLIMNLIIWYNANSEKMKKFKNLLLFILPVLFLAGCEKEEEIPPDIEFKTGGVYTSADVSVAPDSSLTVGIIAINKEDDLKAYNVSVAYDGAGTTTTVQDFTIPESEKDRYEKDVTFTVRDQAGSEKYYFTITDSDGNIAQLSIMVTVE
jgi:hypothetical protein